MHHSYPQPKINKQIKSQFELASSAGISISCSERKLLHASCSDRKLGLLFVFLTQSPPIPAQQQARVLPRHSNPSFLSEQLICRSFLSEQLLEMPVEVAKFERLSCDIYTIKCPHPTFVIIILCYLIKRYATSKGVALQYIDRRYCYVRYVLIRYATV